MCNLWSQESEINLLGPETRCGGLRSSRGSGKAWSLPLQLLEAPAFLGSPPSLHRQACGVGQPFSGCSGSLLAGRALCSGRSGVGWGPHPEGWNSWSHLQSLRLQMLQDRHSGASYLAPLVRLCVRVCAHTYVRLSLCGRGATFCL